MVFGSPSTQGYDLSGDDPSIFCYRDFIPMHRLNTIIMFDTLDTSNALRTEIRRAKDAAE